MLIRTKYCPTYYTLKVRHNTVEIKFFLFVFAYELKDPDPYK
jgi:hypothetical protein